VQGAQALAKETTEREMGKLTAGLNLPPGFGF
jgi:DNA-binding protein YbaB